MTKQISQKVPTDRRGSFIKFMEERAKFVRREKVSRYRKEVLGLKGRPNLQIKKSTPAKLVESANIQARIPMGWIFPD
jgi:hypothetical protein